MCAVMKNAGYIVGASKGVWVNGVCGCDVYAHDGRCFGVRLCACDLTKNCF